MVVDTGCAPMGVVPVLYAPAPPPPERYSFKPPEPPPPITTYSTSVAVQLAFVTKVPLLVKV